jgi:hypothetical protein
MTGSFGVEVLSIGPLTELVWARFSQKMEVQKQSVKYLAADAQDIISSVIQYPDRNGFL